VFIRSSDDDYVVLFGLLLCVFRHSLQVVCRTRIPDRKLEDEIAEKTRNDPYCYPYFYLYHHEYAVLKQRVCEAACVLDSESYDSIVRANGVATIEVN